MGIICAARYEMTQSPIAGRDPGVGNHWGKERPDDSFLFFFAILINHS